VSDKKMRVMVAGDTHGDIEWCVSLTKIAARCDAKIVLQVGDFGYWPRMTTRSGRPHAEAFLEAISAACERFGVTEWIFLDGNHDDHEQLFALGPRDDDGMAVVGERVRYSPRGNRFTLDDRHIATVGGASSMDAWLKTVGVDFGGDPYRPGWDWFPELEVPRPADLDRLAQGPPIDLLLTHEAPLHVDMSAHHGFRNVPIPVEIVERSRAVRELISHAAVISRTELLIHGHWHRRCSTVIEWPDQACRVEGLASNSTNGGRDGRSYVFLDLDHMSLTDGRKAGSLKNRSGGS
jgi:predicted phosphodiesterase